METFFTLVVAPVYDQWCSLEVDFLVDVIMKNPNYSQAIGNPLYNIQHLYQKEGLSTLSKDNSS